MPKNTTTIPTASRPASSHPQPMPLHVPSGSSVWESASIHTKNGITMTPTHTVWGSQSFEPCPCGFCTAGIVSAVGQPGSNLRDFLLQRREIGCRIDAAAELFGLSRGDPHPAQASVLPGRIDPLIQQSLSAARAGESAGRFERVHRYAM